MTTYRLFPSTSGPSAAVSFTGNFLTGVTFTVKAGMWFAGYWVWVCSTGQSTAPVKCALWTVGTATAGSVVPGSVVTSGTLTAGQWNYIPVPVPVQLAQGWDNTTTTLGSSYIAAIGINGSFPDTADWWGSPNPGKDGITNGPLVAYSHNGSGTTAKGPWSIGQGTFSTAGSDPATSMPTASSGNGDNFWVDVQVTDTAPPGYAGTYRLWPNKADANPAVSGDASVAYNVATEIDISQPVMANYIHYFSPPGNPPGGLATAAAVWNIATQAQVVAVNSPAWTTEAGGTVTLGSTGQWVKTVISPAVRLPAGLYRVSVYNANGATGSWNSKDASSGYFTAGAAAAGITWGPLTAPNNASAQTGDFYPGTGTGTTTAQPVFEYHGLNAFPHFTTGTNPPQVYWVDLEVTPVIAGLASAAATAPPVVFSRVTPAPLTARATATAPATLTGMIDISVTAGPTASRAQVSSAGPTAGDGKQAGPTTVNRSP